MVQHLIAEAEEALNNGNYADAGRCYEQAAEIAPQKSQAVRLFRKASEVFRHSGMNEETDRCFQKALRLLEGSYKVEYLMDRWKDLITTIVQFEYDCSFEWRGETDGTHDSYLEDINRCQEKAEDLLQQALDVEGADYDMIVQKASIECRKREQGGGWGASRCWNIIRNVVG